MSSLAYCRIHNPRSSLSHQVACLNRLTSAPCRFPELTWNKQFSHFWAVLEKFLPPALSQLKKKKIRSLKVEEGLERGNEVSRMLEAQIAFGSVWIWGKPGITAISSQQLVQDKPARTAPRPDLDCSDSWGLLRSKEKLFIWHFFQPRPRIFLGSRCHWDRFSFAWSSFKDPRAPVTEETS